MKANPIAIIADSTCDLPAELVQQYQIQIVPLHLIWDGQDLVDGVDIQSEEFYARLENSPSLPKTSQVTPHEFRRAYEDARRQGAREILVVTISSALSGTYQSAISACEGFDLPVRVVDSKMVTMGIGWQVLAAARARAAGGSLEEAAAAAENVRSRIVLIVSLDTLEYVYRGGRISWAARWLGSMLDIKPQVYLDRNTGKIEAGARSRTRARAIQGMYDQFFEQVGAGRLRVAVIHNAALKEAAALMDKIRRLVNPVELLLSVGTPVIGVHSGPRGLALAGYCED